MFLPIVTKIIFCISENWQNPMLIFHFLLHINIAEAPAEEEDAKPVKVKFKTSNFKNNLKCTYGNFG